MIKGSITPNKVTITRQTQSYPRTIWAFGDDEYDMESGMGALTNYGRQRMRQSASPVLLNKAEDKFSEYVKKLKEFNEKTLPDLGYLPGMLVKRVDAHYKDDVGTIKWLSYDPIACSRGATTEKFASLVVEFRTRTGQQYETNYTLDEIQLIDLEEGLEGHATETT